MFFKVLRILEGDMMMDTSYMSTPGYDVGCLNSHDVGCRSGRLWSEQQQQKEHYSGPLLDEAMEGYEKLSLENLRPGFRERDRARRTSCENHL